MLCSPGPTEKNHDIPVYQFINTKIIQKMRGWCEFWWIQSLLLSSGLHASWLLKKHRSLLYPHNWGFTIFAVFFHEDGEQKEKSSPKLTWAAQKTLCIGVSELLVRKSWYTHQQGIHHLGSPFNHFLSVFWKSHRILKGDLSTSHRNICLLLVSLISCLVLASCESDRKSQQE